MRQASSENTNSPVSKRHEKVPVRLRCWPSARNALFALQLLFGALLVVDVGGRTDEFEDFSFCIAQDHGLLEVPAIGPVLSAERPGFERKTLSRAHSVPKGLRCCFAILGVDRGHPGLGMRPDEIESLTGEFKPNLIHEIRCPIRLERPGGYRKMLQQPSLELQLFVGFGKLPGSFRDPPIDFTCNPLLLVQAKRLLQAIAN